ncbi:MAG: SAF domain-containing protein [Mycobacteriales bacterium]
MLDVASPPARRMKQASWLDPRLLGGVLLILLSVIVGARVVSGADKTTAVWAVSRDLPAGHVLTEGDLDSVQVRLAASSRYLASSTDLRDKVLTRHVASDELLPASSVTDAAPAPYRDVSLALKPEHMPVLSANDIVDVIATSDAPGGGKRTWTVAKGLEVIRKADSDGGFGSSDSRILLKVPAELVLPLTAAMRDAAIDVVKVPDVLAASGDIGNEAPRVTTSASASSSPPAAPSASPSQQ